MPINLAYLPPVPVRVTGSGGLPEATKSTENSCAPRHAAPGSSSQQRRKSPFRAAVQPEAIANTYSGHNQQPSFPINSTWPLAASSFRGLSTRTANSRWQSSRCSPHRKTFRNADRLLSDGGIMEAVD